MSPGITLLILIIVIAVSYIIKEGINLIKIDAKNRCKHNWVGHSEGNISRDGSKIGTHIILKCKNCGDLKDKKFTIR